METKLFKKYGDVYHLRNSIINIIVDENFEETSYVKNFKNFNLSSNCDYVDFSGDNMIYHRSNHNYNKYAEKRKPLFETFTFKKNKLYIFQTNGKFWDELENEINNQNEIWYDPFYFVLNEDLQQAERYLKLKQLKQC